jgi:hypothetical protein
MSAKKLELQVSLGITRPLIREPISNENISLTQIPGPIIERGKAQGEQMKEEASAAQPPKFAKLKTTLTALIVAKKSKGPTNDPTPPASG